MEACVHDVEDARVGVAEGLVQVTDLHDLAGKDVGGVDVFDHDGGLVEGYGDHDVDGVRGYLDADGDFGEVQCLQAGRRKVGIFVVWAFPPFIMTP